MLVQRRDIEMQGCPCTEKDCDETAPYDVKGTSTVRRTDPSLELSRGCRIGGASSRCEGALENQGQKQQLLHNGCHALRAIASTTVNLDSKAIMGNASRAANAQSHPLERRIC